MRSEYVPIAYFDNIRIANAAASWLKQDQIDCAIDFWMEGSEGQSPIALKVHPEDKVEAEESLDDWEEASGIEAD